MIGLLELQEHAREWSLRDDIVEKDYMLGWLLWGIASEPSLVRSWVFKGGTCLFTLAGSEPPDPAHLKEVFARIAGRIYEESGIEIPAERIRFETYTTRTGGLSADGRISYRGPRRPGGDPPRIRIDLTADEVLVDDPVPRDIAHPYSDGLPGAPRIACYSLPELFGRLPSDACRATCTTWSASTAGLTSALQRPRRFLRFPSWRRSRRSGPSGDAVKPGALASPWKPSGSPARTASASTWATTGRCAGSSRIRSGAAGPASSSYIRSARTLASPAYRVEFWPTGPISAPPLPEGLYRAQHETRGRGGLRQKDR